MGRRGGKWREDGKLGVLEKLVSCFQLIVSTVAGFLPSIAFVGG